MNSLKRFSINLDNHYFRQQQPGLLPMVWSAIRALYCHLMAIQTRMDTSARLAFKSNPVHHLARATRPQYILVNSWSMPVFSWINGLLTKPHGRRTVPSPLRKSRPIAIFASIFRPMTPVAGCVASVPSPLCLRALYGQMYRASIRDGAFNKLHLLFNLRSRAVASLRRNTSL